MLERDWREIAAEQGARVLRFRTALMILRAFGASAPSRSPAVVAIVNRRIDNGMTGPVPWPADDPAFRMWAAENGFGNVGGHVGPWADTVPRSAKPH